MVKDVLSDAEARMKKTVELFRKELTGIRAGRANAALLGRITVDYYGVPTPIPQMATVTTPEARLMVIQPWDKTTLSAIEKAILKSDLGITPANDGSVIRLVFPPLTQERRTELVRQVRRKAEEEKVSIRNIRREANEFLEEMKDEGEISEDEFHRGLDEVQKLTDTYSRELDQIAEEKEKEIMTV